MEMDIELKGKKRRELQAMCKRHGIPANLTNLEMAHRLSLCLQRQTEEKEEEEKANCKKAKKVVRFSPETETFTYEAQSEVCIAGKKRNRVKRKERIPIVAGLRRSSRLNNTLNKDEGPTTYTKMEMDEDENINASLDSDASDEIGKNGGVDVDSELFGAVDDVVKVDDGSYKLRKKDDQWFVEEGIESKVDSDHDEQVDIDVKRVSKENDVEMPSQAKLSLDISSESHESYTGVVTPSNVSSPLEILGNVAGNHETNICKLVSRDESVKEHSSSTRECVEEFDDDAKSVRSEDDVQEAGDLIVPLPDNGFPGLLDHSEEVNNLEINTSFLDGEEGDIKIQYKLDLEAKVAEENVDMDEDVEDNEMMNPYELNCEEFDAEIQPEIFVENLKMDEDVDQGLERKVVNEPVVEMNGDDLIPGDMYHSPNVREETKGANTTGSSLKDAKFVKGDGDLQESGALGETRVCTKRENKNAVGCVSLPDDDVSELLVHEVTSFEMNMNSQGGEEIDVKTQHKLVLAAIEGRDAVENVMMNEDIEVGLERQVDEVGLVLESGEADIETQRECVWGDELLNDDVGFGSAREVNEGVVSQGAVESGPIVEAVSRGSDTMSMMEEEDVEVVLKGQVNDTEKDISELIKEFMECETSVNEFMEMEPLCSGVKPEICEDIGKVDIGSNSLGDGMSKQEESTDNKDSLSRDSAECTEICEDSGVRRVMAGTINLNTHANSGKCAHESEGSADKVESRQESVAFESNGENAMVEPMLKCGADDKIRAVLPMNDNIGATMDAILNGTLEEAVISNVESFQNADAQMKSEFVRKSASMDGVKEAVLHGPVEEHNLSTRECVEELLNKYEDAKYVKGDGESGAFGDIRICTLKWENINAEGCVSLPDDGVSELLVHSEEVTSFEMNMNSQGGEESDVRNHKIVLAAIKGWDAVENVTMNDDVEVGLERQVDEVGLVSEKGVADIETRNECGVGDELLNDDVDLGSPREVNEQDHHIRPIVEAASIGRDSDEREVTSEDSEAGLVREVSEGVVSLIVEAVSLGSDTMSTMEEEDVEVVLTGQVNDTEKDISEIIEEYMECETGVNELMEMGPLCSGAIDAAAGSGSVLLEQTNLGDGMSKQEGSTENNDSLSWDSAKCTEMCEASGVWKDMAGTIAHDNSGRQESDAFEKSGGHIESNGKNVEALVEPTLECGADDKSRAVSTTNDDIGATMDATSEEAVISNIESFQIADAQMKSEFVQKMASMGSVRECADIVNKKQGEHLHEDKVRDTKENQHSTKYEHFGSILASRNSAHRRPLHDLKKN